MASGDKKDGGGGEVVALSRFRAALGRARARPQALALLDQPDVERRVPRLPVQELFYAIKEVGLHDATEIVQLASPAQIQGFLDLDAWHKDRYLPEKVAEWLDVLMDAGPDKLAEVVAKLDGEVVALFIQRNARVYDLSEGEAPPPEQPEGHFYPTPDTFYLLDVVAEGEAGKRLERFIDWLYRADLALAKQAVMAAKWELPSDLEEHAYRWRSGRVADLGYVDYFEALGIYQPLDPSSVKVGEGTAEAPPPEVMLPAELVAGLPAGDLLGRALAAVTGADELERLSAALMLLTNRVMSADLVEPGDLEGAKAALDRVVAYLDLGLELLSGGGAVERAAEALRTVALSRVFRVGVSLTLKLKKAADALVDHAWVSLRPGAATLLDPPLSDVVAAARRDRPRYPASLDGAGRKGAAGEAGEVAERPFRTLGELARAARALEEAAQLGDALRRGLGVEPRLLSDEALAGCVPRPEAITFATVFATLGANLILGRPASLVPLAPADLPVLRERAIDGDRLRPVARLAVERGLAERLAEREFPPPAEWDRWVAGWLAHLREALLVSVDVTPDLILRARPARPPAQA